MIDEGDGVTQNEEFPVPLNSDHHAEGIATQQTGGPGQSVSSCNQEGSLNNSCTMEKELDQEVQIERLKFELIGRQGQQIDIRTQALLVLRKLKNVDPSRQILPFKQ